MYSSLSMQKQQRQRIYYDQNKSHNLSISRVTPSSATQYQVRLPPISQPIISKYRGQKFQRNIFRTQAFESNIFTDFFCGKSTDDTVSMCDKCERQKNLNLCNFILQVVEQNYDWRNDNKFRNSYDNYSKKRMEIFLTDEQIGYRIQSKFNILGVLLLQNHKLLLMRIIKNYIKHTIYYGDYQKLTLQNDLYFWFLIGIYFHVGTPKNLNDLQSLPQNSIYPHQQLMFWALDIIMQKLKDCSQQNLRKLANQSLDYYQQLYPSQYKCLDHYQVNLKQIIYQWTNQLLMGYMGIQFIGFFIKSSLKQGFVYGQKVILSYCQKRILKLQNQEVINIKNHGIHGNHGNHSHINCLQQLQEEKTNKRDQITKYLVDSNEQWPGIFFNTSAFDFT